MSEDPIAPQTVDELQSIISSEPRVLAVGNRTKEPLSRCPDAKLVSLRSLSGIIEYEPSEFTFTARAGTTVVELAAALAERRQYLPFDPMLRAAGATIGGTIAAGLSGPGRFRYGGIRDFLIGVQFISGDGNVINAGGKVVKNAAGFDIPKFLVGSMGRLAAITEVTFKVFPHPPATESLRVQCISLDQVVNRMAAAAASRWELDAIDYRVDQQSVLLRLAGPEPANEAIAAEIQAMWGEDVSRLDSADEFWRSVNELCWSPDSAAAVKIPCSAGQLPRLYDSFAGHDDDRLHWSVAGNVLWYLPGDTQRLARLDEQLRALELPGLVIRGPSETSRIGTWTSSDMESAVKAAMDPPAKFPDF